MISRKPASRKNEVFATAPTPATAPRHPSSNRFIGDVQPTLGQQIFDIAEADGKAKTQPHGVPDDVRRELVASERDLHRPSYPRNTGQRPWA